MQMKSIIIYTPTCYTLKDKVGNHMGGVKLVRDGGGGGGSQGEKGSSRETKINEMKM